MANTQNLDLVKPLGTDHALVSVLNSNSDKIDAYAGAVNASLDGLRDGLGILADGNTHAAITSGQFVYVKNHQTLPQGLYQATTNIAANGTLSTSNLTADPKGGLNTLSEQIATLNGNLSPLINAISWAGYTEMTPLLAGESYSTYSGNYYKKYGNHVHVHLGLKSLSPNTSVTIFQLPAGYRPIARHVAVCAGGETVLAIGLVIINPNGNVDVISPDHYAQADFEFLAGV